MNPRKSVSKKTGQLCLLCFKEVVLKETSQQFLNKKTKACEEFYSKTAGTGSQPEEDVHLLNSKLTGVCSDCFSVIEIISSTTEEIEEEREEHRVELTRVRKSSCCNRIWII